jgi:hypothetical protein
MPPDSFSNAILGKMLDIPQVNYSNPDDPEFLVFMRKQFWIQNRVRTWKIQCQQAKKCFRSGSTNLMESYNEFVIAQM